MPQILDIYPGTIVNLVFCLYHGVLQAATRLCLLSSDYLLTRCLSRKGWDQNTAYHQLTTWANGTNHLRASLDQNATRAMFLSSLGSSIMANQKQSCLRANSETAINQSCNQKLLNWARPTASRYLEYMMAQGWCPLPSKIPLVLLAFAITLKGINTLRG